MSTSASVALSLSLPPDVSGQGHHVDDVFGYLTLTTGICFAVLASVFVIAIVWHRGPRRVARYTHGTSRRERWPAVVAAAVVLFGVDAVAVVKSASALRAGFWSYPDRDPDAVRVEVTAQQWAWNFRYPGSDGVFNTADDIVTLNDLRAPVGRPLYLQLTSKDVIHSLYLPNFRTKIDAVPGTVTRMWVDPRQTGTFEIGCAQHCGAWHYKMRGELTVMNADAFARWQTRAQADAALRFDATDQAAHDGWAWMPAP
jgi:cytochrome c oxidase subunit 2